MKNIEFRNSRLAELREQLGLTLEDFGGPIKATKQEVWNWENRGFGIITMTRICNYYDVDPNYFFAEKNV